MQFDHTGTTEMLSKDADKMANTTDADEEIDLGLQCFAESKI